ncbi:MULTISPECIES: hypothetical protein [unclassified Maridesulfovibrio]|uniref:hypothetical protein n=1 Tax=unclassified Maridesulfovibrio TaxID=2794999 RepID=UPI003B3F53E3
MKFRFLFLVSLMLLGAGCVSHTVQEAYPVGKIYNDSIEFRGMSVPLPEGDWQVIGRGKADKRNFDELVLTVIKENKPGKALLIARDTAKNKYTGYWPNKYLQRTNILFTEVTQNTMGKPLDGWLINHIRPGFGKKDSEAVRDAYEYMTANKLVLPGNFIESRHILTGKRIKCRYLSYSYLINPETDGFEAPENAEWGASDWNVIKINGDPKKVAYIERFKKENAELHSKLRNAFDF